MRGPRFVAMAFVVVAWVSPVHAQTLKSSLRVNVATPVFEYVYGTQTFHNSRTNTFDRVSIGPRSTLGLGVGYGLRERMIVGADLWLGYEIERGVPTITVLGSGGGGGQQFNVNRVTPLLGLYGVPPDATLYRWSAQVAPYLELALGRGVVRPFVGVTTLFALRRDTYELGDWSSHQTALQVGYGFNAGVHAFLSDAISLDGSARIAGTRWVAWDDANEHATSVSAAVIVGVSGWIR